MSFDHFRKLCEKYRFVYSLTSTAFNGIRLKLRPFDSFNHVELVDHTGDYSKIFAKAAEHMKQEVGESHARNLS